MITEREKQSRHPMACYWVVRPDPAFEGAVLPVQCLALTRKRAKRVAEAEHPGVPFSEAEYLGRPARDPFGRHSEDE